MLHAPAGLTTAQLRRQVGHQALCIYDPRVPRGARSGTTGVRLGAALLKECPQSIANPKPFASFPPPTWAPRTLRPTACRPPPRPHTCVSASWPPFMRRECGCRYALACTSLCLGFAQAWMYTPTHDMHAWRHVGMPWAGTHSQPHVMSRFHSSLPSLHQLLRDHCPEVYQS